MAPPGPGALITALMSVATPNSGGTRLGEPEGLRQALAGRYRLERAIGRGGMATVYLAHDLRHDRPVALKVLHPGLAPTLGLERFQREIRLAARLQHPHILTVLDSGAGHDGLLWFTMPYVQGESLRQRLDREHQLPVEDAVAIAREAAEALAFAHAEGVVHRDVKPENILLGAGHAMVADFGIALAVRGGESLTDPGLAVGTPAYMSPEQAAGDRELDGRTDVYALGTVLYEMLAGQLPYPGPATRAIVTARRTGEVPSLDALRPDVPVAVQRAIEVALAPDPEHRFATADEFARALGGGTVAGEASYRHSAVPPYRRPAVVLLLTALILGLVALFTLRPGRSSAPAGPPTPRRLAVLPFQNLGRAEDDYFADGITDEIRGKLAALSGLQVTASASSAQYKRTAKTPQEIGRELGGDYLLTGKVRWEKTDAGSRVRVSPELIQVATASTRWQQPFDASLTDVFQVQAEVASRVAAALDVALEASARASLGGTPTANLTAYDLYLQGNEAAGGIDQVAPPSLRRAVGFYRRAVELDSSFAPAWAQLSRTHSYLYYIGVPTALGDSEARAAADRALSLAPGLAEAHLALGDYYHWVRRDGTAALAAYTRGSKLAPNNAELLKGIGLAERSRGNWELSQQVFTRAFALDPRSVSVARRLTYNLTRMHRLPEALSSADRALALDSTPPDLWESKAIVLLGQGKLPEARALLEEGMRHADPVALVEYVATYFDLYWALSDEQQQLLVGLSPAPFDGDRQTWGLAIAGTWLLRGDTARARAYADSARIAGAAHLREVPLDGQLHALQGTALAILGRKAEAIREGQRALELLPPSVDANAPYYMQHQLARTYIMAGEQERAIDLIEPLLRANYYLTPGWLRVDPTFDPLRGNPRFQRLTASAP
jgi:TolB-like protein/Flp pilus assembly protein TadD